ncbi:TIGR03668 family PPOX class F420-dependent oxidoreductase [Streptomyces sp. NPDC059740]|uniref:TIGR03668 family PPOX class F420-dependent oxidoreductase n=1 Tax=Streptomyces sp. NPDC059740 TaxID=3346926 RepID=UPI003667DD0E
MPRMTDREARERFAASRIARLATADAGGRPHLVPVVFAVTGDLLVTAVDHKPKRTRNLGRLADIGEQPAVSLLADHYEEDWDALWWARADGRAQVLEAPGAAAAAAGCAPGADTASRHLALLAGRYPAHYREHPPQGPVIEVTVERWSGWRAR